MLSVKIINLQTCQFMNALFLRYPEKTLKVSLQLSIDPPSQNSDPV